MADRQEDAAKRYPYDPDEDHHGYDEALDYLRASRKDGKPHIPTFARSMLELLKDVGLLHRTDTEPPVNVRKAKMDKEQEVWIRFDTHRVEDQGYMVIEAVDVPRSDKAILAAMVAWLAQPIDFERLLEAWQFVLSGAYVAEMKRVDAVLRRIRVHQDFINALRGKMFFLHTEFALPFLRTMGRSGEGRDILDLIFRRTQEDTDIAPEEVESDWEEAVATGKSLYNLEAKIKPLKHLEYLLPLIRYYRPEFDNCSAEERQELIDKCCGYINDFLKSFDKVQGFLEYGAPNRKLTPAVKNPNQKVQAAVLYDVDELNYRQIGERMGIPLPPDFEIKGEHQTVRKMVERGREILKKAFGEEGWPERVETMKAQKAWWRSLSEEERDKVMDTEISALNLSISVEEARRRAERHRS
jgi:hypothetical protein